MCVCVCVCVVCVYVCLCVCAHTHSHTSALDLHSRKSIQYIHISNQQNFPLFYISILYLSTTILHFGFVCVGGGWGGVTVRDGRHSVTFHAHAKLANRKLN
jgi:hypothetical protein